MSQIKIVAVINNGDYTREIGSWNLPLEIQEDQEDVIYYIVNELNDPKVTKLEIVKIE